MEILLAIAFVGILIYFASGGGSISSSSENIYEPIKEKKSFLRDSLTNEELKSLAKYNHLFESIFEYPLTDEQAKSIVSEADRVLVIASAGSGKTSTILAKYFYLVETKKAKPEEILILAFARPVAEEIKKRLKELTNTDAEVETFHSFGKKIINKSDIEYSRVDESAKEDGSSLISTKFLEKLAEKVNEKSYNKDFIKKITQFATLCPYPEISEFASDEKEYRKMISKYPYKRDSNFLNAENKRFSRIPTLNGDFFVRSQQELTIANYLIMNGIQFEYEKNFPLNTSKYLPSYTDEFGSRKEWDSYKPDFYFPEADLWFEHFAIDKNSNKSPFGDKYVDEHDKKIKFHEENRTNFVCTYMSDYYSNNLLSLIDNFLNNYNLTKNPISDEEIEENLKNIYRNNVLTLVREEIKLFKASQTNIEDAKEKISQLPDKFRSSRFLEIFLPLYEEYQSYLKETESIDFEDMIKNAVEIVDKDQTTLPNYKYILVDEFQDISDGRFNLLDKSLRYTGAKLFGVGDDWQSIYRFTGADISLTTRFEKINLSKNQKFENYKVNDLTFNESYGYGKISSILDAKKLEISDSSHFYIKALFDIDTKNLSDSGVFYYEDLDLLGVDEDEVFITEKRIAIFKIQDTFRYGKYISSLSSNFIQKNKNQIKKSPKTKVDFLHPIYFCNFEKNEFEIDTLLKKIPKSKDFKEVLILGRNNSHIDKIDFDYLKKRRPDLVFKKNTIHSAKGAESDVIILLGLDGGPSGFPRRFGEDPLKEVFLPEEDSYLYAEERRVMYVALTRAKKMLFICYEGNESSSFYSECLELSKSLKIPFIEIINKKEVLRKCPECEKYGRPGGLKIKTRKLNNGAKPGIFLGCNMYNPDYEDDELYCDYAEFNGKVDCPECLSEGKVGYLGILSFENELFISCSNCNFKDDYFKYHK
tara:strand:+ start:351 stop:3137 length:2787 start_codon:yes stop_codon:yes gene_type:complete